MAAKEFKHPVIWVSEHLGVGPAPMSHTALDSLREQGVRAILNLCAEFTDLHRIEAENGFEVYHLPIEDEAAPGLAELEKALDWLDEALYLGKKVFIHCRHGIGRTGTVLNAYLLRRGLGHRRAWLALRKLRSQPSNFRQWRLVRRYGKAAVPLTLRAPSLEHRGFNDMEPFYTDLERLDGLVEAAAVSASLAERCGRDHARCCSEPFDLCLAEAVRLNGALGQALSREKRQAAIERAVKGGRNCPLLHGGQCQAFALRPLRCRMADLPEGRRAGLWADLLGPVLEELSREMFETLTRGFMPLDFPRFSVAEAVSGRYVQVFFNWQKTPPAAP